MSSEKQVGTNAQPQAVAPMVFASAGNRNVKQLPYDNDGKRDWSFGLLCCFADCNKCCFACWCPCLAHAQNRRRLDYLNINGIPDPNRNRVTSGDSALHAVIEGVCDIGWVLQIRTRKNIRERYSIRGSEMSDGYVPVWCQLCDLVQGSRELQLEEDSFGPGPTNA